MVGPAARWVFAAAVALLLGGAVGRHDAGSVAGRRRVHAAQARSGASKPARGRILLNAPLPPGFPGLFASSVAAATGCGCAAAVHILAQEDVVELLQLGLREGVVEVTFEAPAAVVHAVEQQAGAAHSKLAAGALHSLLVADGADGSEDEGETAPVQMGIDVDTDMPYGELEPFGREDTAAELTKSSIQESDEMVDQLERAEVAEEKRSVFRALTRLRGAAITSFDGVARAQTGNIDEYNRVHKWRKAHPLHHLADEESDISKWAFPNEAD